MFKFFCSILDSAVKSRLTAIHVTVWNKNFLTQSIDFPMLFTAKLKT